MINVLEEFSKLSQKEKFNQLRKWDIEYYEQDNPSVSDEIYDACVREYNGKYKKKYISALGANSSIFEKYEHISEKFYHLPIKLWTCLRR